jgi:hypothetical protein
VSSVGLGRILDLNYIAEKGHNLHYYPESFTPMVMRIKEPTATGLIFQSGKMVRIESLKYLVSFTKNTCFDKPYHFDLIVYFSRSSLGQRQ